MRQREAGDRGANSVGKTAGDAIAIQHKYLRQLESEQPDRRQHEQHDRELEAHRREDQPDRPAEAEHQEKEAERIADPGQPAGDEMPALPQGQFAVERRQQGGPMEAADLHRAIGPAEALLAVGGEIIRHHAAAEAFAGIHRLPSGAKQPEAEFRVLADRPFRPAADIARAPICGSGVMVPCWMMALRSLRVTMPSWKNPAYSQNIKRLKKLSPASR